MKFAFNGRFLTKKITGQERFALELILHLDKICNKEEFCIITSYHAKELPKLNNIPIIQIGNLKREAWEQFCFGPYLRRHHLKAVNLTSTFPLLHPDIVCIHDVSVFDIGGMFMHSLYGFFGTIWKRLLCRIAAIKAKEILTVSEYSKKRMSKVLHIKQDKIHVIYNAWQHMNQIKSDDKVLKKYNLVKGNYFFSLSSLSPQKNFIWTKKVAQINPQSLFVVTGKAEGFTRLGFDDLKTNNIIFTGYLSDEEMKCLMQNCKAFIHPAIYEGFGIPPLEALACGAQVIVSNSTCLPEIYKDSVHYIDPYNYNVNLTELLKQRVAPSEDVLKLYDWNNEARKLLNILRN